VQTAQILDQAIERRIQLSLEILAQLRLDARVDRIYLRRDARGQSAALGRGRHQYAALIAGDARASSSKSGRLRFAKGVGAGEAWVMGSAIGSQ